MPSKHVRTKMKMQFSAFWVGWFVYEQDRQLTVTLLFKTDHWLGIQSGNSFQQDTPMLNDISHIKQ